MKWQWFDEECQDRVDGYRPQAEVAVSGAHSGYRVIAGGATDCTSPEGFVESPFFRNGAVAYVNREGRSGRLIRIDLHGGETHTSSGYDASSWASGRTGAVFDVQTSPVHGPYEVRLSWPSW